MFDYKLPGISCQCDIVIITCSKAWTPRFLLARVPASEYVEYLKQATMKENLPLTNSRPEFKQFKKGFNEILTSLGQPHIDSFNQMLSNGLNTSAANITPLRFQLPTGEKVEVKVESIHISSPSVPPDAFGTKDKKVYPMECRQRGETYKGMCSARIGWNINGLQKPSVDVELGEVPIMLKSDACNLKGLTPEQLVKRGEHENEWGGYFIVKGNEKMIRMLLMTRRNYPIAVKRSVWKDRGALFSDLGILVRTARNDETSFNNVLHYLNNGSAKFMFSQSKMLSYVPVCLLLRALTNKTDDIIYSDLLRGYEADQYYSQCIQNMLRELHEEGIHTQLECKNYVGELFRSRFIELPPWTENVAITDYILNERILVHLYSHEDKYNFIVLMVQKLFQCAQEKTKVENVDGVMMQDVLLGGHLYQRVLIERIEMWLIYLQRSILKKCNDGSSNLSPALFAACIRQAGTITRSIESFLATGSISSRSGLGLMQSTGLVIMAENINRMRYMSHFRAVHRGSYFTTMRTTEARQLLPDAWGFICPVHTPDGAPCGLLNHLTVNCQISGAPDKTLVAKIPEILIELGMAPISSRKFSNEHTTCVMLEGRVLGYIREVDVSRIVDKLRYLKVNGELPQMMEIVSLPYEEKGQYSGLFLFVGPARMMRPVKNLHLNKIEFIGTFEQVYMNIAIDVKEIYPNVTTHMELSKTSFLSNLANLIPMPDCNQSPRNMYQCQMGKQTMGTPCQNFNLQSETKLYRLQTPSSPLFRTTHYDNIDLDDFAMGTNAIVAVISYTGYDMEDAMIINKSAHERGFAYGSIYKSQFIELRGNDYFARNPHDPELAKYIDNDGLPAPGTKLTYKCVLYCYFDTDEATYKVVKNEEKEDAVVDNVRYCGSFALNAPKKICITIRIPRKANIGDKFASRAGQKGICSQKYPAEDLPFTESGLIPDIVFNPHGFPSRMTIAMMIEAMAGKSAAIHGLAHDATPFRFSEKNTAIDYFGKMLQAGGYNYYGTERMYSGVDGREIVADVFFGVVYYQRLRHMVFDKWQVRSTGPVDVITQQPIKGRKRGGGVRFGEMERDALISHGSAFLLQDRLFYNSDKVSTLICNKCGTLIGPMRRIVKRSNTGLTATPSTCKLCHDSTNIGFIEVPFAFKYLVTELASININANFKLSVI